jgi:hypothetical protein
MKIELHLITIHSSDESINRSSNKDIKIFVDFICMDFTVSSLQLAIEVFLACLFHVLI